MRFYAQPRFASALRKSLPAFALCGAFGLSGCLFGGNDSATQPGPGSFASDGGPCVDLSADARAKADQYVKDGNNALAQDFKFWFSDSRGWTDVKGRSPQAALTAYDQALAAAPGDCRAKFGRAIATASMLTQDKKMDDFVGKVDASVEDTTATYLPKRGGFAGVFKISADKSAPALLKLSHNLASVDKVTLEDVQSLIETTLMPKLDSTITALEEVMDYSMFSVHFTLDGDTVEIDRGEIGPGLAGLKVAKAWLTVVAGYNLDVKMDGTYDWVRTLADLNDSDFDHLATEQKAALDHLEGLFDQGSQLTRMKPQWKDRLQGVPALLESAVGDAQKGLTAKITEAASGDPQKYDLWRAGMAESADIDTVDLRGIIEILERSKKYLRGEVPIDYNNGTTHFRVNFAKIFTIDGLQGKLPYFKFYPYEQWNDTVGADTSWDIFMGMKQRSQFYAELGYPDPSDSRYIGRGLPLYLADTSAVGMNNTYIYYPVSAKASIDTVDSYGFPYMETKVVVTFAPLAGDPCTFHYVKSYDVAVDSLGSLVLTAHSAQGDIHVGGCKVLEGNVNYAYDVYPRTRGPFYFTDTAGNKTIDPDEIEKSNQPSDMKGKIVFRDPTFGGVLPDFTNDNFWDYVSSLRDVRSRVTKTCTDNGIEYRCTSHMPDDPSDLDYMVYYLNWSDRVVY